MVGAMATSIATCLDRRRRAGVIAAGVALIYCTIWEGGQLFFANGSLLDLITDGAAVFFGGVVVAAPLIRLRAKASTAALILLAFIGSVRTGRRKP